MKHLRYFSENLAFSKWLMSDEIPQYGVTRMLTGFVIIVTRNKKSYRWAIHHNDCEETKGRNPQNPNFSGSTKN